MSKEQGLYQVALKLLLRNEKGETLLLKEGSGGVYKSFYDLPGGRIDVDEFDKDFFEVLKREISEEIGDITYRVHKAPVAIGKHLIPGSVSRSGKDIRILYILFLGELTGGEIRMSEEHLDYRWIDLSNVKLEEYLRSGLLDAVRMFLERGIESTD